MRRRLFLLATAGAVAGCSSGDGSPEPTETTTTESPTPTPTQPATEAPPTSAAETATETPTSTSTATPASDVAQTVEVAADGFTFSPDDFKISPGDQVRWVWRAGGHNVVASSTPDGSDWSGTSGGSSTTYDQGYEYTATFEVEGRYQYYCAPHRDCCDMTGAFTVE